MRFKHTDRPGFWLGFIDFFTAGLFFLLYMPFGGLQAELEEVLGHKVMPYWKAYLLGIPTLFIYTLVWMARIAEELKTKAINLGLKAPYTSWWHMFGWNTIGLLLFGPEIATYRFFDTLNKIEKKLNEIGYLDNELEMYFEDGAHASRAGSDFAAKYIWETIYSDLILL